VSRAAKFATRTLQFVVTNYYYDNGNRRAINSFCIAEYGYSVKAVNGTVARKPSASACCAYDAPFTAPWGKTTYAKAFYKGLQECVQHAVALGFTDAVILNPRLDQWIPEEGKVAPIWRAWVPFGPLDAAGGLSFYDAMLAPLAGIATAVGSKVRDWKLALGGEHQWSYTAQAAQYTKVLALLRKLAPGGRRCSTSPGSAGYPCSAAPA
jgi:hypothetical protein